MAEETKPKVDWELLALTDQYSTAVAIRDALREGDVDGAIEGLEELIDALSRSDERALESRLIRLMQHIIKWKVQPERRSPSWVATIREQRRQIQRFQRRSPRFTDRYIQDTLWDDCYAGGLNEAAAEINREHIEAVPLRWHEVFALPYTLEPTPEDL
jgi:Domain of unknown function DUF29